MPFFTFIQTQPGIKAVCYINRDWGQYERWARWGDCRLEQNAQMAVRLYRELGHAPWLHAAPVDAEEEVLSLSD